MFSERIATFSLHITGWKRRVFERFFPDREFIYLPFGLENEAFEADWRERIAQTDNCEIFVWGTRYPPALPAFSKENHLPIYFIEDGFLRSNSPNAARTPPLSLAFDRQRPYFDSRGPSDLEVLLETGDFNSDVVLMDRARQGIQMLIEGGLSKYNSANPTKLEDLVGRKTRPRILVIGQVEDDASIAYGCDRPITNNDLVRLAAEENPDAEIIYKPHPDVLSGMRPAQSNPADVEHLCHVMRVSVSLANTFDDIDKAYAITSLGGFEALLRGIPLVVLGCPFYASWGLTDDRQPNPRRTRKRTVEEVFAAAYLLYPAYFDPASGARISFEQAVEWLKVRLEDPNAYKDEFVEFPPPKWAPWGPYGLLGWRFILPFFVTPIVKRRGSEKDVREYRENPIRYFRDLTSPNLRLIGRLLYPFDPPR
ncbi:capsular polysaccharide biosynthesis protein [Rhizobium halophytocola]|uniref:Capsule polysaccharide export protein KpsC/LpsZ n=1 Tax=Rhizobium halophytocola TaxID=735519 RepID=A0ABS4E2B3_9HYPH|nr:capsular polysaccharide biosynthesis protein [Rhizobium halophytocola]MBP1852090.1 capsule polysaccharide export protein KpsC/LpsZ [Rhizobium halophytocola]